MITFKTFVTEARKNPHLNPKVPINFHISQHYENAGTIRGTRITNSFVSFTDVDKLGINPGSYYKTPVGIYSYPSEYILDQTASIGAMRNLPFAGNAPYANVFSVAGNIIDLSGMSDRDVTKYARQMVDVFIEVANIRRGGDEWKEAVDYLEDKVILNAPVAAANPSIPGSRFWWLTREMSKVLMEHSDTKSRWRSTKHSVSWNKLFRTLGIDGCIDSKGDGIIHTSEPYQGVFFSIKPIKKVERYYNKYSPEDMEEAEAFGSKIAVFKSVDPDEMAKHITDNPYEYRSDVFTDSKFIGAIHPIDPKIQVALLRTFLVHPPVMEKPVMDNVHVFSKVSDSDVVKIVEDALSKGSTIVAMIEAGLIREDNITPEIVNALIGSKKSATDIAYRIRNFAPNLMEPIISMVELNDRNVAEFIEIGKEYFAGMRGSAAAMDRATEFGKALVDHLGRDEATVSGMRSVMRGILSASSFDSDDEDEVVADIFGDS